MNDSYERSFIISLLTGILCIILFVVLIVFVFMNVARNAVSRQSIETVLSDVSVGALMEELDIFDTLTDNINQEILDSVGITPDTIDDLLDQNTVREDISEILSEYALAIISGDTSHTIPNEAIASMLEDNAEHIERVTGHQLTDNDIRVIENSLNETGILDQASVGSILEHSQVNTIQTQRFFSQDTFFLVLMSLIIAVVCLLLLNIKYLRFVFKDIGVTLCSAGLLIILSGLVLYMASPLFFNEVIILMFIGSFISILRVSLLAHGLVVLIIGIVLIITGAIMKRNFEKAYYQAKS